VDVLRHTAAFFVIWAIATAACTSTLPSSTTRIDAGASQLRAPCAVAADCHNPYLTCASQTFEACRESGDVVDPGLPTCPMQVQVTEDICSVTYQLPCHTNSDCGPAGFSCSQGICQETGEQPCSNAHQCPVGWLCGPICPCGPVSPDAGGTCVPPFAIFNCTACSIDGGALVRPDATASGPG
jgi:hypothetical protein